MPTCSQWQCICNNRHSILDTLGLLTLHNNHSYSLKNIYTFWIESVCFIPSLSLHQMWYLIITVTAYERNGISYRQPHDSLLNRLFRRRSKKTSKLRAIGLCAGNSPAKRPVTRKMSPLNGVISACSFEMIFGVSLVSTELSNTEYLSTYKRCANPIVQNTKS